jgi:hypothetical protein
LPVQEENLMAGKGTTVQISPATITLITRRGARSSRGGGDFARSAVLNRTVAMLQTILEQSDPRRTRRLPDPVHALAVELLAEPWALTPFEIERLPTLLEHTAGFIAGLAAHDLDRQVFLEALSALTFAEKAALVDAAIQLHAPKAAMVVEPSRT